ncbi:DUF4351 domain-containing protein [Cylindrospermum stagnale]
MWEQDSTIFPNIKILSANKLENLGEALFDFSHVHDLEVWLSQEENI